MITINDYLDGILDDFQKYLDSGVYLCDLKDAHFDAGKLPDYRNIRVQQLYLLRYAYAYAFEYKCMYEHVLETAEFDNTIKVTSIGCGAMIDYWALAQTFGKYGIINYKGLDIIDWSDKIESRRKDSIRFILGDAVETFESTNKLTSDIYIFPKSISEFSYDEIDRICNCFMQKYMPIDKTHLLISLRSDEHSLERDMIKSKKLFDSIIKAGFRTNDNSATVTSIKHKDKKIRELDTSFRHPKDVVDLLKDLNQKCKNYDEDGNCNNDCQPRLNRWPMLSCKNLMWQFFTFERK